MSRSMIVFLLVIAPALALVLAWLGWATVHENLLGWFLLLIGGAYLVGGPIYLWKHLGVLPARREETSDRSFWLIQPGFLVAILGAPLEYLYLPEILPRAIWLQMVGLVLLGVSVALHTGARLALRGQFSGHVQIQPKHQLIQSGPYRHIRHPGYLSYMLMTLGISIGYSSLLAFAASLVLLLPGLVYRMGVEEKLLDEHFGEVYRHYARTTKRLIPGIW